ncbi:MAG: insulinase family protein [Myxococcales bacterium]|nr:insulinase family protein [Myxococcales bacterium]
MRSHLAAALLVLMPPSPAPAEVSLSSLVHEHTLENGMKWLIVERHQAPVFTGFVRVRAGGADEEPGYTGLAHLFEHMAFKGTPVLGTSDFEAEKVLLRRIAEVGDRLAALERAGKGEGEGAKAARARLQELSAEHSRLIDENALATLYQLNGAAGLNATTDKDLTSYFVSLPKNRLELWATVEAQRLASPVLRDFYTERDVVMEERRTSIDSSPLGALYEELLQISFTSSPYRWPTVGYQDDLAAMTLSRAHEFHERYYVPSNAVGCIAGDVRVAELVPLLERTFGAIPAGPAVPGPLFAEPPQRAARRSKVTFDASPRLALAFRKPPPPERDDYVFDVLQVLLGEGRTGRLHRRLVIKDRLAQGVGVFGGPGARLPNLFIVLVTPLGDARIDEIERAVWEELERLKSEPVASRELEKVRNRVSADHARSLETNAGLASVLSYSQAVVGDWRYAVEHPKVIESITAEDVQRVARQYFTAQNGAVAEIGRPRPTAPKPKPPPRAAAQTGGAP